MLIVISWRNIWRHPVRSSAVMGAVVAGLLAGNFVAGFATGAMNQAFRETIENQVSHIQVHHPAFPSDPEARHRIEDGGGVFEEIRNRDDVRAASARLALDGMVASASMSAGARIVGVDPVQEARTTGLDRKMVSGTFLEGHGRLPPVVIGRELAGRLKADTGSRIVLTFQDAAGELVSASFRVEGIFSLASTTFEEKTLFVKASELDRLVRAPGAITEIAVLLEPGERYREITSQISARFPQLRVRNWEELAPALYFQQKTLAQSTRWVMAIFLLGVAFGVLNTILMSVLERTRELGMLMAVGMKRINVFTMVMLETLLLAVSGSAAGLGLSFLMIRHIGRRGIDLSLIGGENLRGFGFSPVVYFDLEAAFYLQAGFMVVFFAVLAAIYPALRAVRLVPAEAVRRE